MSETQQEVGRKMEPADALRMLARANDWLQNQLRQSRNCQCGACYLCAFYTIEQVILDRRGLTAAIAESQGMNRIKDETL